MKIASALLISIFAINANAAGIQTQFCGQNLTQLKSVMSQKFSRAYKNPDQTVAAYIGKWRSGSIEIPITRQNKFVFAGANYTICPQNNGSFYVFQTSDRMVGASFRLNRGVLQVYGASGILQMAQGNYSKGSTTMLAGSSLNSRGN